MVGRMKHYGFEGPAHKGYTHAQEKARTHTFCYWNNNTLNSVILYFACTDADIVVAQELRCKRDRFFNVQSKFMKGTYADRNDTTTDKNAEWKGHLVLTTIRAATLLVSPLSYGRMLMSPYPEHVRGLTLIQKIRMKSHLVTSLR